MPSILPKHEVDADVLTLARERMGVTFDLFDHVAVAFSGGKDSTACLHLALDEARARGRLPLDVVFFDEEAIHPETVEYVERVAARPDVNLRWYCVPVRHRNACSRRHPYWHPWKPDERDLWVRQLPDHAITELPGLAEYHDVTDSLRLCFEPSQGSIGIVLGLRAQESIRRFGAVSRRTSLNWISADAEVRKSDVLQRMPRRERARSWLQRAKPIYDWKVEDVWTAPHQFGWDYNRAYDVMRAAGIPPDRQRVCQPFGEEPLTLLWAYSACWPELWNRMLARVPGAAAAGRYALSPVYAHRAQQAEGWNPNEDPREQVERAIQAWPEPQQSEVRKRVHEEIRRHYKKTPDVPIPLERRGFTGLTWRFLYMLAKRGDTKRRRQANYR